MPAAFFMATITVQPGQTLYGIYGPNWKQASGYTGDPTKLAVGTKLPAPASSIPSPVANTSTRQGPVYTPAPVARPQLAPSQSNSSAMMNKGPIPMPSQNTSTMQGATYTPAPSIHPMPVPTPPPTPMQKPQAAPQSWASTQVDNISSSFVPKAYAADKDPVSSPGFVQGTPDWVKPMVQKAAEKYNIPTALLSALLKQESGFNPSAKSPVGAMGIAQFMPGTAQGLGVDPLNPESAIDGAAKYLRRSWDKFGKPELALAAYNAGGAAVNQYGGIPPYKETQNYVKNIMAMSGEVHDSANGPYLKTLADMKKESESKTNLKSQGKDPAYMTPYREVVSPIPPEQMVRTPNSMADLAVMKIRRARPDIKITDQQIRDLYGKYGERLLSEL